MNSQLPPIRNLQLQNLALTHRSYANEHSEVIEDNERLEFLGDAVLGFLIGEMLYKRYPQMNEAQLTHLRSKLVDEKQLGKLGAELGVGRLMLLGQGADKDGGRENPSLLNDTFEALIGAYFLDAGIEATRDYIEPIFLPLVERLIQKRDRQSSEYVETFIDSKNRFQQWSLSQYKIPPTYKIIAESGPDHAKEFTAQVSIKGKIYGIGKGRRKQEAEKRAAEVALKALGDR